MKAALKSVSRYPARSIIYTALLTTSFTMMTIIINTYFTAQNLLTLINGLYKTLTNEERIAHLDLFDLRDSISVSMSSLIPAAILTLLLCVLILPLLQYLFTIGRGHEIGILRALGMSRGRAWSRLLLENILLLAASLAATQIITLTFHRYFTLSLLSINAGMAENITEAFAEISAPFSFNWHAPLYALGSAVAIIVVTAGLCNILISGNAPLKLIRDYK